MPSSSARKRNARPYGCAPTSARTRSQSICSRSARTMASSRPKSHACSPSTRIFAETTSVALSTGIRTASTSSTSLRASSSSVTGSPTIRNSTSTSCPWWNALNSQFSAGSSTSRPAAAMAVLGPVDVLLGHREVGVVAGLRRAARPRRVAADERERDLGVHQGDGGEPQPVLERGAVVGWVGEGACCSWHQCLHADARPAGRRVESSGCASRPSTSCTRGPSTTTPWTSTGSPTPSARSTPTCSRCRRWTATSPARTAPTSRRWPPRPWAPPSTGSPRSCTASRGCGPRRPASSSRRPPPTGSRC